MKMKAFYFFKAWSQKESTPSGYLKKITGALQ